MTLLDQTYAAGSWSLESAEIQRSAFVVAHSANMLNTVAPLFLTAGDVRDDDPSLRDRRQAVGTPA